ncbi:MAG: malto-oligosyltrehalose synthase [Methanotrichaceae archaeon]
MRLPVATYRLQFNSSFGFKNALEIVPYLAELGISDIYASPIFKAKKGSPHGYDIVDQNILNPELGTPEDFDALIKELRSYGMGWIQDIVPNHMSYSHENRMLSDILERGSGSEYCQFFDIEWDHPWEGLKGKLLAPFLGDLYGKTLELGEIKFIYDETGFAAAYYGIRMPLRLGSYAKILSQGLERLEKLLGEDNSDLTEIKSIILAAGGDDPDQELKNRLWELYSWSESIKRFVDSNIESFNGKKGDPESFNSLDNLLSDQRFRLSFWKVASDDINYRRFFIVNDLICIRTERNDVFDNIHSFVFDLIKSGKVTGLRIDHLDGLYDPANYVKNLREKIDDIYIVAEKILLPGEELPSSWQIQGTTGYDFLNSVNGVLCDKIRRSEFEKIYSKFSGQDKSYSDIVYEKKKLIADMHMSGEVDNLALLFKNAIGKDRYGKDLTFTGIKKSLTELLVDFPIYRTYIDSTVFSETDRTIMAETARRAKERNRDLFNEVDFLEQFILLPDGERKESWLGAVMRFQQFTGPLMAKGAEDTALYVYCRLLSLNEVGGDPEKFGLALDEFHDFNESRAAVWPNTMNATSTHDTKRGEDARSRINVLSEMPEEWERHIETWSRLNGAMKNIRNTPDRNDEYFLYQSLIGAIPFASEPDFRDRIKNYLVKAVREAKTHSGWAMPDTSYEAAFISFLDAVLDSDGFIKSFMPFQRRIAYYGILNSLAQTLIKITAPGIPDFYQGTEIWDLSFVDPDNRRPVNFGRRISHLREIMEREKKDLVGLIEDLIAKKEDGRIKLFLIHRALKSRNNETELFSKGSYIRLNVQGCYKENAVAFARRHKNSWAITIAPRLTTALVKEGEMPLGRRIWSDTSIIINNDMPVSWINVITDQSFNAKEEMYIGDVLDSFPVALLLGRDGS